MIPSQAPARGRNCILAALSAALLLGAGCSASAASRKAGDAAPPPDPPAVAKAREEFARGREAALAGDFQCASEAFSRAVESVRPAGEEAPADPEIIAFSTDLYEGILRYEAMAPPVEAEAQEMADRAPMLAPAGDARRDARRDAEGPRGGLHRQRQPDLRHPHRRQRQRPEDPRGLSERPSRRHRARPRALGPVHPDDRAGVPGRGSPQGPGPGGDGRVLLHTRAPALPRPPAASGSSSPRPAGTTG